MSSISGAIAVSVQVDRLRQAARTGGLLTLPLTGGVSVQFRTTWVHADATQSMVAGPLLDAEGEASLTLVGDVLAGRIVMNGIIRSDSGISGKA